MGQAFYRKYRSKTLDEVVGQDHITKTLQNALKTGKISHAYLFTGPRGVGKTSVARILAHEVNNLRYTDESIHLDIIEIDAASNRRIDEIRDLRDKVHIAPTSAKYKVYIIDEVHMLTREAFNALLKTLEEPPAHCIFILATTEAHKLPETIISRTQRFTFKPIEKENAVKHLGELAKKEKIDITTEALELLSAHGGGSFRDSISLLDQLNSYGKQINKEVVRELLGLPDESAIENLIMYIKNGDSINVIKTLDELSSHSATAAQISSSIGKYLRQELINGNNSQWIPDLLKQLLDVPASSHPQESLEISLLEFSSKNKTVSTPTHQEEKSLPPKTEVPDIEKPKQVKNNSSPKPKQVNKMNADFSLNDWPKVVEAIKNSTPSLYTALRLAIPTFENNNLTLNFQFPLHQKKLGQAQQKELIGQAIEDITGAKVTIESVVNKPMFENKKPKPQLQEVKTDKSQEGGALAGQLQTISSIFGKSEVLES